MATIEQFKQVRASVSPQVQTELYGLLVQDLDAAVQKMIAIGAENNISFTVDEVKSYLRELDEEDELAILNLNLQQIELQKNLLKERNVRIFVYIFN